MRLAELARGFRQIEATAGRHQMTALLADLFRRGPEDAGLLPHLLEGRLGPPYAAPNLGLDERRIAQAIAEATGTGGEEVWRQYKSLGDLGLVAERLLPARGRPLTIHRAYEELLRIARASGLGAYEQKVGILRDLLRRLGGGEARYLVRIAQGRLRLGVGDATVLDALSVACVGDLSIRARLERAYSFCSDLGLVARTLFDGGPSGLDQIHPSPGRPVLSALAERLPSPQQAVRRLGRVIAEPKYDGLRLQAHKDRDQVWLFTRRLEDVTHAFPDLVQGIRRQVTARQAILDGEAVGYNDKTGTFLAFQETVRRRRKHGVEEMEILYPLRYYLFDLLFVDGQDCAPLPLQERSRRLRQIVAEQPAGRLFPTPQIETADPEELERFFDEMVKRGLEGVLVKRPDAPYHAGARRFNWVKLKRGYQVELADTFDVVVVGYYRGRGKRAKFGIGSLLAAVYDPASGRFRTVSRVGSGLTDAEWTQLRQTLDATAVPAQPKLVDSELVPDVWVEPQHVIEVIASEITRSPIHTCGKTDRQPGYALRFPRVSRLRFDRRAEDATTEAEVIRFYGLKTGKAA